MTLEGPVYMLLLLAGEFLFDFILNDMMQFFFLAQIYLVWHNFFYCYLKNVLNK